MSYSSFRDKPRLSDRLRGRSGNEIIQELKQELDQDRKKFFETRPTNPNWSSSSAAPGSAFSRSGFPFDEPYRGIQSHLDDLAQRHPEFADQLRCPPWGGTQEPPPTTADSVPQAEAAAATDTKQGVSGSTAPEMGVRQGEAADGGSEGEGRGQRSMSAPPDARQPPPQQRFVSKIEINPAPAPASQPSHQAQGPQSDDRAHVPQHSSSGQAPRGPTVRHIPIFVEGRDEPVLPKEATAGVEEPPMQAFRRGQHYQAPPQAKHPPPQGQPHPQFQPPQPQAQPQPQPQAHPHPQPQVIADPMDKVECVRKEVEELRKKVEAYQGTTRTDKEYIYLDEMLTRNLIKLDVIETEGKETLRNARKEAIRSIQSCISLLESKVPIPESMEVVAWERDQVEGEEEQVVGGSVEIGEGGEPTGVAETPADQTTNKEPKQS